MVRFQRRPSGRAYAAAAALAAVFFVADTRTELGVAVWVFYLTPVALTAFGWRLAAPLWAAAASSALILAGYFLSPPGSAMEPQLAQLNRTMGAATVWIVAAIVRHSIVTKLEVAEAEWLRAAQARLAVRLQGEQGVDELCGRIVRTIAETLEAPVGAMYVAEASGRLRRAAAWAGAAAIDAPSSFAPGEALVGQAAVERRLLEVSGAPPDYLRVASALGQGAPAAVLVSPAVVDDAALAVVEVGFFRPVFASDRDLLEAVSHPVAVAVRSAQYRTRVRELLEETQRQAEELQAQQEELRVANEELQEQTDMLAASQARLEAQQADLEASNAQLELQTSELEAQRDALEASRQELAAEGAKVARASRYKSEFLANMSHELRTPLNSILILAKLLAEDGGASGEERTRYARSISSAGKDLLALIEDVLDLSKIEAGRLEVRPEPVPVARVVEGLVGTFAPVAAERGLSFDQAVDPAAPQSLETDPQRLQQILANLLSNAFKFTERGGVTLRVAPAGPERVSFAVEDTGIGIAPDQQEVVFEAFHQLESGASRRFGGTGLGLAISRDLARMLGGEIALASEPGAGSTFTLTVPVRAPAPGHAAPPAARAAAPRLALAPRPPKGDGATSAERPARPGAERSVLIVEDDPQFAATLCALGGRHGFACHTAATAEEGFALAVEHQPSAVLLDVGLPDHSGLAVLEQLKRDRRTRHIPVHVVSGRDEAQLALQLGAVGYALKPISPEALAGVFAKLSAQIEKRVRRVLVVEDDATQREGMARLLASDAVEIAGVGTMSEALERLAAETFDCVVVDLALPDGSGFELLDRMSAEERYSFPPVIVYTGRSLTADEEARLRRTSSSIIVKGARSPERLLDEVTLFLHQVEADLPPERRRMLQEARSRDAVFEGRRLLVVEDDVRNVFALTSVLEPRGAQVDIARNGREALDAIARGPPPDLVLMDIMMPEMDGYEAMRRIRADPALRKLPIIALTARAMKDDQEKCLAAGANDYLAKPIDVDRLLSLVRVWLPR
jgi:CheY-like chemotaxis protein